MGGILRALIADHHVWLIMGAVLLMDACLLLMDVGFRLTRSHYSVPMGAFSIAQDGGYGERAEYVLSAVGAGASLWLAWRHQSLAAALVGLLFCAALADNALQLHEQLGMWGAHWMPPNALLAGNTLLQLLAMTALGVILLAILLPALMTRASLLNAGLILVVLLISAAAAFGVFVDALHSSLRGGTRLFTAVTLLEDGGELVCLTLAGGLAASLVIVRHKLG